MKTTYIIELYTKQLLITKTTFTNDKTLAKKFKSINKAKSYVGTNNFNLIEV